MNDQGQILQDSSDLEILAFDTFAEKYRKMFPAPERVNVTLKEVIGWQFWLSIFQGIFAIALASMRTADMFYKIAISSSYLLAVVEAVFAVGAIEGGIVIFAALRAETQNRKISGDEDIDARVEVRASVWRLLVGEFLALAVSIVAGLGLSFTGLGINAAGFTMWLAIIVGAGASVIAAIAGDVIGTTLARLGNTRDRISYQFHRDMQEWEATLYTRWKASDERKIARGELHASVRSAAYRTENREHRTANRERANTEVHDRIFAWLNNYAQSDPWAAIPGPTALAEVLGISKSYAHTVTQEWLEAHGDHHEVVSD